MIYIYFLPIFILSPLMLTRFLFFLSEDSLSLKTYLWKWLESSKYHFNASVTETAPITMLLLNI
jgi:hypothetical protein